MDTFTLSNSERSRLDEVASLMLDIYQTLARMQYLDPEWIVPGPHDPSGNAFYRGEIDDSILYLYSVLPYVDTGGAKDVDFYDGGEFARFDNGLHVSDGRNPLYSDDEDEMMKPWMTPLSMIGNHETCIIYGFKNHPIWIFSQSTFWSVDPGLGSENDGDDEIQDDEIRDDESQNDESHDDESQDDESHDDESHDDESHDDESHDDESHDDESHDDESHDDESQDNQSHDNDMEESDKYSKTSCRSAGNVLRDINKWYKQLEELPGGGQHSPGDWDQTLTKPLYIKHGWLSGNFDADAFQADRIRSFAVSQVQKAAQKPLETLEFLQRSAATRHDDISTLTQQVDSATTPVAEWDARWNLLIKQQVQKRDGLAVQQQREKIARLCPGGTTTQREQDMPLWEAEWLRVALVEKKDLLHTCQNKTVSEAEASDPVWERCRRLQLKHAQREVDIYQRAYEASRLDAQRLCPGETFTSATGWVPLDEHDRDRESPSRELEALERSQADMQVDLAQFQSFLQQVPEAATDLRHRVELCIEDRRYETQERYLQKRAYLEGKLGT